MCYPMWTLRIETKPSHHYRFQVPIWIGPAQEADSYKAGCLAVGGQEDRSQKPILASLEVSESSPDERVHCHNAQACSLLWPEVPFVWDSNCHAYASGLSPAGQLPALKMVRPAVHRPAHQCTSQTSRCATFAMLGGTIILRSTIHGHLVM